MRPMGANSGSARPADPSPRRQRSPATCLYVGSYDGKFYALDANTGAMRWRFATGGERRFEAKGLHGMQPKNQTIADPFDVYLSSPVVAEGAVFFGSGDGNVYALDAATGDLNWKFQTGDVVHASPALRGRRRVRRQLGQLLLCGRCQRPARRNGASMAARIR